MCISVPSARVGVIGKRDSRLKVLPLFIVHFNSLNLIVLLLMRRVDANSPACVYQVAQVWMQAHVCARSHALETDGGAR